MSEIDPQLVAQIAEQVIKALQQQQRAPESHSAGDVEAQVRASIQPPIGACTGDYSKFPELKGKLYDGKTNTAPAQTPDAPAPANDPIPLTGIVTANQLQSAIESSPDGVAHLTADARPTPLANDFIRQHPAKIRRVSMLAGGGSSGNAVTASPWVWWMDGMCSAAQEITRQRSARLRPLTASRSSSSLGAVTREVASLLKGRQAAGALLFVQNAARASCFANRCSSIRAVVGTCGEAVEQSIAELGANCLVIEYPHVGPKAMAAMIDRMLQTHPKAPATIERELADLGRL